MMGATNIASTPSSSTSRTRPRGRDIRLRLGEIKLNTQIRTIAFEIKSRQSLSNPNSVGEILLSEFYRSIGLAENFVVARIERRLQQLGLYEKFVAEYETSYGKPWQGAEGRDDLMTVRRRIAQLLPIVEPDRVSGREDRQDRRSMTCSATRRSPPRASPTSWSPGCDAQKTTGGKVQHLVFVIDEMGTFIGDSTDRIGELNSLAEMIGNKGKGKVWLIVTSQQDLEKVVDRTNFQPALVGRLNARFELKPHLISDEINKVVSERILKKHPSRGSDSARSLSDPRGTHRPARGPQGQPAVGATERAQLHRLLPVPARTRSAWRRTSSRHSRDSASRAAYVP